MPRKKQVSPDIDAATRIAAAFMSLHLNPEDPQDWVAAVREAGAEYPSEATIEQARRELHRMMMPPIQIVTKREAHHLRRRRK